MTLLQLLRAQYNRPRGSLNPDGWMDVGTTMVRSMQDVSTELRANVRVNVLRRGFSGFVASFADITGPADDMIEYWKQSVPGLSQRLEDLASKLSTFPGHRGRWSLRSMVDGDKNTIIDMFESDDVYTGSTCEFQGERVLDMYLTCAIFLHSRRKCALPRSNKSDKYGLWAAYNDLFPESAQVIILSAKRPASVTSGGDEEAPPKQRARRAPAPSGAAAAASLEKLHESVKCMHSELSECKEMLHRLVPGNATHHLEALQDAQDGPLLRLTAGTQEEDA